MSSLSPKSCRYIIGADAVHYLYLGEFKKEYPDAKLIAVEDAIQKRPELTFDGCKHIVD